MTARTAKTAGRAADAVKAASRARAPRASKAQARVQVSRALKAAAQVSRAAKTAARAQAPRVRPTKRGSVVRGKVLRISSTAGAAANPALNRLTVIWVQENGVPFDTTGFTAELLQNGTTVQTAPFDRYGTVQFSRVKTLTVAGYTVRILDENGETFRTRTIPAGVEAYAVIG